MGQTRIRIVASTLQRVSAYYFLVFLSLGCGLPYFALWMSSVGMSDKQIGVIAASPSFVMVATTLFAGSLADRARDWRSAILVCNWLVLVFITGIFFVQSFVPLLILWCLWGVVIMAKFPILDAAAIRMARHRGMEYHKMRACGSLGFVIGVLLGGLVFEHIGISIFLWVLWGVSLMRAVCAHFLPLFRTGIDAAEQVTRETVVEVREAGQTRVQDGAVYRKGWFLLVLAGSALIQGSHAYYYTFSAILWNEAGYSTTLVSVLWAAGVLIEIVLMWKFALIKDRYTARYMLIAAALTALLRWFVFGLDPGLPILLLAQLLHGVTFALMFLATVNFIANWTPVKVAAKAQALSATMNTFCMALATVYAGMMHQDLGVVGYWSMAVMCFVAVLLIATSFKLNPVLSVDSR